MPMFHYVALEGSGQEVTGTQAGASEQEVLLVLTAQQLYPLRIDPVTAVADRRGGWRKRIRKSAVAVFYSQLSDLLRSGVPLLRSLELLQRRTPQESLREVVSDVREQVSQGVPLAAAMQRHPRVFTELAVSTIRAGEEGGFLEDVLKRIAVFSRKQEELKSQIVGALAYPVFLLTMGAIIVTTLLVFFVPKFGPIFERISSRGELPWATTALLGFSGFLRDHGLLLLAVLAVGAIFATRFLATKDGKLRLDRLRLALPGLGPIIQSLSIARFCRVLGTLLRNGVPILKALRIAKDATANRVLTEAVATAAESLASGKSLTRPLLDSKVFPEEVVEMIAVGADANNLEQVLIEIGDNLESEAQRRIALYVRLIEPVMLLIIAALILFVVVGLLLPIFQSSSVLT